MSKRINVVPVRFTDEELLILSKCASREDRAVADYVHHFTILHLCGYRVLVDQDMEVTKSDF